MQTTPSVHLNTILHWFELRQCHQACERRRRRQHGQVGGGGVVGGWGVGSWLGACTARTQEPPPGRCLSLSPTFEHSLCGEARDLLDTGSPGRWLDQRRSLLGPVFLSKSSTPGLKRKKSLGVKMAMTDEFHQNCRRLRCLMDVFVGLWTMKKRMLRSLPPLPHRLLLTISTICGRRNCTLAG